MMRRRTIALLTDWGHSDNYVGVVKGVILTYNKNVNIVDLSHDIPSHDVLSAYYMLQNSYRYFPTGTIFIAVVDPEVGSARKILCIKTKNYIFMAPDNGLISFLYKVDKILEIRAVKSEKYFLPDVSNTFHGRDIFAPVAAKIAGGLPISKLGGKVSGIKRLDVAPPTFGDSAIEGEIVAIDKFGNLITNISGEYLNRKRVDIRVKGQKIDKLSPDYISVKRGGLVAYVGSSFCLEIAVNKGSAEKKIRAKLGDKVVVKL